MTASRRPAVLVLEDGRTFRGDSFGADGETFGEAVFATGMTGYQETLTDPSYHKQVVVMTAPHIGNTGVNDEDGESSRIWVAGYVVRDPARVPSNWRSQRSLDDELVAQGRGRRQRDRHACPDPAPARARRDAGRHLQHRDGRRQAARTGPREPPDGRRRPGRRGLDASKAYVVPAIGQKRFTVAALDLGIKAMTPRRMAERGIEVHVVPARLDHRRRPGRRAGRRLLLERAR